MLLYVGLEIDVKKIKNIKEENLSFVWLIVSDFRCCEIKKN